jgi:hypothetical protein
MKNTIKNFLSSLFTLFLVISINAMLAYANIPFGAKVELSFFMIIFFIIFALACKDWNPYSYEIRGSEIFFYVATFLQGITFLGFIGEAVSRGINCP